MFSLKNNINAAVCLIAMWASVSCVNESEPCPDVSHDADNPAEVTCRLTVVTKNIGSRADHTNETEEPGVSPESYIDFDDLQLMLFNTGRFFVQYLTPQNIVDNGDGSYDIDLHIQDHDFMSLVNGQDNIRFYILALANGRSLGSPWLNAFPAGAPDADGSIRAEGTPLTSLMNTAQSTTMTVLPETYRLLGAGSPDVTFTPQYMPMSGIQTFNVPTASLKASTADSPFDLEGQLSLLRALAKIEIVDHINYLGSFDESLKDSPDRIDKIELAGYVNKGNLLPSYASWQTSTGSINLATSQLTSPWLPENASYINPPIFNEDFNNIVGWTSNDRLQFVRSGETADGAPVYSCYVYEYLNPAPGTSVNVTQPPYLCVTLNDTRVYTMRLATYADGESTDTDYLTELVRNHIYRYQINSVTDFRANLTLDVLDWDSETTTWMYSDNIGIAEGGEIEWTPGTYQMLDQSAASVLLKQDMSPAQCKFTIATPTDAMWRAIFIPIGDTPSDAFAFRLADGSTSDFAEGELNGNEVTLEIIPTDATPQFAYSARLQIIVTLGDGRSMNADVLNGAYGDYKFFTIKQNPQL